MEAGTVPIKAPDGGSWGASPALLRLASDARLIAHVRAGRERAFETVYDRHHRSILAFCTHLLGDRHEAEDAVQHTFMAAYNGILTGEQDIQLRPWLFAIARNRCFSLLRARREVAVPELDDGVADEPATVVQRREDLRDLVEDVSRLPPDQRAALVMAEISALSHDEIALALEVPREKVKALVFQARESLMASRTARETDCSDIRTELITLRGPALRRRHLRRHLHECEGCRAFRSQLRRQHSQLAALVPLAPSWALKETVLRSTVGGRAAGALGGSGTVAASAVKAGVLKAAVSAAVAVLSAASAVVAVRGVVAPRHRAPVPTRVHLAIPSAAWVPDAADAAAKARVFARAAGAAAGAASAHATLGHAGVVSSAGRYARASMSPRLVSRPVRPHAVQTASRPTPPLAASPLQASVPAGQATEPVVAVTPKASGDAGGASTGAASGTGDHGSTGGTPTGDHGSTGGTPTGDHGSTGGTPTGDHGSTGGTPTGDHGTTDGGSTSGGSTSGGSTSGGSTTGGAVAGESSGGAHHRRVHLHQPRPDRAGSPGAVTSPTGTAAPATSSPTSTAGTGGAPAAGATLTGGTATGATTTGGTSAGRTSVAAGATPTGIDQYRPVITSTRRTAPWPKPKDHSPAKSSPSPAAPAASGAPPRRH